MNQDSQRVYRNNNLFSNYFLENYIKKSPEWGNTDHIAAFEQIKAICNRESKFLSTYNEKQLENHFFNEIFTILGFEYEVTEPTEARNFPDYAFFSDRKNLEDAHKNKDIISFFTNAIAIGEVKQWKVDLDKISKNEYSISENPSLQIRTYLDDTKQKWGILTNGRYWRLYCKEKRRDDYLEVDLPFLILSNDIDAFRFFFYFFRKDAFIPSKDGPAFLDRILKESFEYATEIGDSLKENVYWAMKRISEGFIDRSTNNLDRSNPTTLILVQKNSMLLLYRFLFLLYAEGKGLLDLNNPKYLNNFSFHRLKHNISEIQDGPIDKRYTSLKCSLLAELKELFKLVNQGSESFDIPKEEFFIPAYNGGLFDPNKHPELEQWEIGDQYLADAIDLLSRSRLKDGHRDFVDYSTLEIRHLGSIYEGLLEYKLRVAESDLVVSDGGWVKLEEYNEKRKQKKIFTEFDESNRIKSGGLYLATDKGERKSTGSYYTPDYIVNFIVTNTIGPVVNKKWQYAQEKGDGLVNATLSVNILDPAMGSGHFLVGAVDFLSQRLLEAVEKDHETGKVTDTTIFTNDWARREIVSHCIYGVDLNELAVELAKVGLWLTTISKDKPLSFLDHRLKQGNSLIGARLTNLRYYPGTEPEEMNQTELPTSISRRFIGHILSKIAEIEAIEDHRLEDIKKKEKVFNEFKQLAEYQRAKGLADVYTSTYFGNEITPTEKKSSEAQYQDLVWAIAGDESEWRYKTRSLWFKQACDIAKEKSFFHWELEFPEIFFDAGKLRDNPGWDAVIGNPPYIRAETADKEQRSYLMNAVNYHTLIGRFDVYLPFVEKGVYSFLKKSGNFGMIIPRAFLRINYAEKLRKSILEDTILTSVVDFKDILVFKEAAIFTCIPIITRTSPSEDTRVGGYYGERDERIKFSRSIPQGIFLQLAGYAIRLNITPDILILKNNVEKKSIKMGNLCYCITGLVGHDSKTGASVDRLIHSTPIDETCKPYIEAKEWDGRYSTLSPTRFIEYKPELMHRPKFPELFESQKILIQRLTSGDYIKATIDLNKVYVNHVLNCCVKLEDVIQLGPRLNVDLKGISPNQNYNLFYILSLINSRLIGFYHNQFLSPALDIFPETVRQLPIRKISFNTSVIHRSELLNDAKDLYKTYTTNNNPKPIIAFVDEMLNNTQDNSDVIHDYLAFLAEKMIELNNLKNIEIATFLQFVENEIGISIDKLSNKTLIQSYYKYDFTNFIEVLLKNKRKLKSGYSPKSRSNHETLKDWYSSSISKLTPILHSIDDTDFIIDQIVYKLYGLSEDDVKIVEEIKCES